MTNTTLMTFLLQSSPASTIAPSATDLANTPPVIGSAEPDLQLPGDLQTPTATPRFNLPPEEASTEPQKSSENISQMDHLASVVQARTECLPLTGHVIMERTPANWPSIEQQPLQPQTDHDAGKRPVGALESVLPTDEDETDLAVTDPALLMAIVPPKQDMPQPPSRQSDAEELHAAAGLGSNLSRQGADDPARPHRPIAITPHPYEAKHAHPMPQESEVKGAEPNRSARNPSASRPLTLQNGEAEGSESDSHSPAANLDQPKQSFSQKPVPPAGLAAPSQANAWLNPTGLHTASAPFRIEVQLPPQLQADAGAAQLRIYAPAQPPSEGQPVQDISNIQIDFHSVEQARDGLDVTIRTNHAEAAARMAAHQPELLRELSRIGSDVEAINVELKGDRGPEHSSNFTQADSDGRSQNRQLAQEQSRHFSDQSDESNRALTRFAALPAEDPTHAGGDPVPQPVTTLVRIDRYA